MKRAALACVFAVSGLLPWSAPAQTVTATKDDGVPAATKIPGGGTVNYTTTVTATGATANDVEVSIADVDRATMVDGSIHISPLAINDTYDTLANTALNVGGTPSPHIEVYQVGNLYSNDILLNPPSGTDTKVYLSHTNPTNGTVTLDTANGTFLYVPAVNFVGSDSFTYTIRNSADATLTDTSTVTINVLDSNPSIAGGQKIWYVQNNAAAGGLGRSSDPFDTLAEAEAASGIGDTIYIHTGSGTTGQDAGITLKNSQRLIGQGVALTVPVGVNGVGAPTTLRAAGTRPSVTHTTVGGNGVSFAPSTNFAASPVEILGLNLSGHTNAIDITTTATSSGTVEIAHNIISAAGVEGIDVNANVATANLTLSLHDTTVTATGNGIDLNGSGGTLRVTDFRNLVISGDTGGDGIRTTFVVFDASPSTAGFQQVSGGNTIIGSPGNPVGGSGLWLTNFTRGDLAFTDLDSYATGAATLIVGQGAYNSAAESGFRFSASDGVCRFEGGAGGFSTFSCTNATLDILNATLISTGATHGIALTLLDGVGSPAQFSTTSGSSITDATVQAIAITTGNGDVTYRGTITDDVGTLVYLNGNTGGTLSFTGAISDGNDGDGGGISLTNNTGATINFSGGLTLSTGGNAAFTATGGGTLNVTGTNTIATTSGQALNIDNTTIGASGITFRSIASGAGSSNGISLVNTGTTAGLTVTGTGSAGSGGTINGKLGADGSTTSGSGIYLNNTKNVSLNWMTITNHQNYGIRGIEVDGFRLANSLVGGTNGTNVASPHNEGSVSFIGTPTTGYGLRGAVAFLDNEITGGAQRNVSIDNATGTMNLNFLRNNVHHSSATTGDDGLAIEVDTSAVMFANISNNVFTAHGGDHFNLSLVNNANADLTFANNDMQGGHAIGLGQGVFVLGASYNGTFKYDISNNGTDADPFVGNLQGGAIHVNKGSGSSTFSGQIANNVIGNPAIPLSGSAQAYGIRVETHGSAGSHHTLIHNNKIREWFDQGMYIQAGEQGNPVGASLTATITNNTLSDFGDSINSLHGIYLDMRGVNAGDNNQVTLDVRNNSVVGAGNSAGGGADIRLQVNQSLDVFLAGYSGGNNATNADTFLTGLHPGANVVVSTFSSGTLNNGPAVPLASPNLPTLPAAPLLFAPAEVNSFDLGTPDSLGGALAWTDAVRESRAASPVSGEAPEASARTEQRPLTQAQLDAVAIVARERWAAAGLTQAQNDLLATVSVQVADLPDWYLGEAAGLLVRLDRDAGGQGWFIDATPLDDGEFHGTPQGEAAGRVDLLTTVMHEMGHALGLPDSYSLEDRESLMYGFLTKGERRLPRPGQAADIDPAVRAQVATQPRHATVPVSIGALPAGKTVVIKYRVTVNDPLTWNGQTTLTSQDTVTGSNFTSVNTNDPETPAAGDATVTNLDRPDATIVSLNRASANPNRNSTVTWQIVLSQPVLNLTPSNFALVPTGVAGAVIQSVSESDTLPSATWNLTASTGTGDGTLGLSFLNDTGGSHDVTNAPFVGETYTIDKTAPLANSIARQQPTSLATNADSLVFRVTFSESVTLVDTTDFVMVGTTAVATEVAIVTPSSVFDVTVSGGDLANLNAVVNLALSPGNNITDLAGNALGSTVVPVVQHYTMDNTAPTVAMSSPATDPTGNAPIPVTVTFSEPVVNFTSADITPGNATVANFTGSNDVYTFDLVPSGINVTATASIAAATAEDAAGNPNTAATAFSRQILDAVSIATVNPGDDDAIEGVDIGRYTFTRGSSAGLLVANFQLHASSTAGATTDFTLSGGSATLTAGGAGTVTFPPGVTTVTVGLSATAETLNAAEAAETARFDIVPGGTYVAGTPSHATVTIAANGFLVTNTNDAGEGSLRQAVLNANAIAGADAITFSDGSGGTTNFTDTTLDTITLTGGQLPLSSDVTIQGTGANKMAVSGNAASRVFQVASGTSVRLSGLTITSGGAVPSGGGILNDGTLVIFGCAITGNQSSQNGGGFRNNGSLAVINSVFNGNTSLIGGAASNNSSGTLTVVNSTFHDNEAAGGPGGALHNSGSTSITSSTISGNRAGTVGGAFYVDTNTLTLTNSIIAGNTATNGQPDVFKLGVAAINSGGHNLIGNASDTYTLVTWHGTDIQNQPANLGPLQDNGGPTRTMALLVGSPALNAGSNALLPNDAFDVDGDSDTGETLPVDQRGVGFTRAIGTVDIGAYELQKSVSIAPLLADQAEGSGGGTTDFTFTVSRTGDTSGAVTIQYAVTGSSGAPANAADFGGSLPGGSFVIPDTQASAVLTIPVSRDAMVEPDEEFTVTLSAPDNGYVVSDGVATGSIDNDDASVVTLTGGTTQNEGNAGPTPYTFTATLSNPVQGGFSVAYATNDGTATAADDYTDNDGTLAFTGTAGESHPITVLVTGDTKLEPTENFNVTLGAVSGAPVAGSVTTAGSPQTGTITNDDTVTLTLEPVNATQAEGTGGVSTAFTFSVTLDDAVQGGFSVSYTTNDDTATVADGDYTDNDGTLVFTGTAGESQTITVQVTHDDTNEEDENFDVAFGTVSGTAPGVFPASFTLDGSPVTATIQNDDNVVVNIAPLDPSADENTAATGAWRVSRNGVVGTTEVNLEIAAASTAVAADWTQSGATFASLAPGSLGTATIPPGQAYVDIVLTPQADIHAEADETVVLNVQTGVGYDVGATPTATVTIGANDFVVINTNNGGEGTLRQALANAGLLGGSPTVTFEGAVFTDGTPDEILLTSGQLTTSAPVTVLGPGADRLSIDAGTISRVFYNNTANVILRGLTIKGGHATGVGTASAGGGVFNDSGASLSIIECHITGNTAETHGGGLLNHDGGTMTIVNSTLSNNTALGTVAGGGGIASGTTSTLTLINSTLSGNGAPNAAEGGGGLYNQGMTNLHSATLTGNSAGTRGGGISVNGFVLVLQNTIVSGNSAPLEAEVSMISGTIGANRAVLGHAGQTNAQAITGAHGNIFDITATSDGNTPTALVGILGSLQENGGPTPTHALAEGSPAFDAGNAALLPADTFDLDGDNDTAELLPVDQRGGEFLRVIGAAMDIGAVESFAFDPTLTTTTTDEDTLSSGGLAITPHVADGGLTTHFKVTAVLNGSLFLADGTTPVASGTFLTLSEGAAGLRFLPAANLNDANTPAGFGFSAQAAVGATDADLRGLAMPVVVTVDAVNDLPSFTKGLDILLPTGTNTAQTFAGWTIGQTDGDSEAVQALSYQVSVTTGAALFTTPPAIDGAGTLTFTPSGTGGYATVSVTLTDDDTIDGTALTTAAQTFTISVGVNPALDKKAPIVKLLVPTAKTKTVGPTFDISGTVNENIGLTSFTVKLNGTTLALDTPLAFTPAVNVPWSVTGAAAENGPNLIEVEAIDLAGRKTRVTKTVSYVNLRPELAGLFSAWIDPVGTPGKTNTGLVTLTVAPSGAFSGRATIDGAAVAIRGVLKNNGDARFYSTLTTSTSLSSSADLLVPPKKKKNRKASGPPRYLGTLTLRVDDPAGLSGTLSDATPALTGNFAGPRAPYSKTNRVPQPFLNLPAAASTFTSGRYTVAFASKAQTPPLAASLFPQGDGYASLSIAYTGVVKLSGYLADGSKYAASGYLRADGTAPLHTILYSNQGSFGGNLAFTGLADSDVTGASLLWIRPALPKAKQYVAGWPEGIRTDALGTKYAAPASLDFGQGVANTFTGNANLVFEDGLLSPSVTQPVSVDPATGAVVKVPPNTPVYNLKLAPANGVLSGNFLHTDNTRVVFRGILLNKGANQGGFGFFISNGANGESGGVTLDPSGP